MTEPVKLVVSIDTEEDNWQPVRDGITVENIRELPRLDRFLSGLGLRTTYFTTYQVAVVPWAAAILRAVAEGGHAEIGAHVHPWNTPPGERPLTARNTMLVNLPRRVQIDKIMRLTDVLTQATGRRPRSFRAGRWGFGRTTAAALLECGYEVDSSITPFKSWASDGGPSHVGAPLDVYRLDGRGDTRVPAPSGRLVELPMSWGYARESWTTLGRVHERLLRPGVRWLGLDAWAARLHLINPVVLSPEIETVEDMLRLSQRLLDHGVRHLQVSWHSPTMWPGLSPFANSATAVEGLYRTIAEYVEGLARLTPFSAATVGEAGAALAPPVEPVAPPPERHLVVVSYHFPPDPAIGGMRWAGFTKYLGRSGWRSWVVTAAPAEQRKERTAVTVLSRARRRTLNDLYLRLRFGNGARQDGVRSPALEPPPKRKSRSPAWVQQLRVEGGMLLALPDEGRGWVSVAARAARGLIGSTRPVAVVSSGPPHSAHLAAWIATRFTGVPWFVDMRDPWAGPFTHAWREMPVFRSAIARWVTRRLERLVFTAATGAVCNTREFAEALSAEYPSLEVEWIPNGVDREVLPAVDAAQRYPGLGLAHVGTIYGGRSLSPVLRALRAFLDRHREAETDGTRLRIAGHVDDPYQVAILREIEELRLGSWVELLGVRPRAEAMEIVGRSRLAIVLAQDQEYQVPAKLYELAAMRIPTVVIATAESAAGSEARRLGAEVVGSRDLEGLVGVMERAWREELGVDDSSVERTDYSKIAVKVDSFLSDV